jgi:hypothetical protein
MEKISFRQHLLVLINNKKIKTKLPIFNLNTKFQVFKVIYGINDLIDHCAFDDAVFVLLWLDLKWI